MLEKMLMKLLRTIAALSAALTPLMAEVAFSAPLPDPSEFPRVSNPEVYEPVCYLKTTGGSTLNLTTLCGTNADPVNNNEAGNRANTPTNNGRNNGNGGNAAGNPGNRNRNPVVRDSIASPTTSGGTGTGNTGNNRGNNSGTSTGANPNNGNTPGNAAPNPTTTSDVTDEGTSNPRNISLPRIPPSSFSPSGVAPTRDAIDGPRNQQ